MRHATHSPLAAGCLILALGVAPLSFATETHAPVVAEKRVAPGATEALNPQPIPPGRAATGRKAPKPGEQQAIIFVGGKKTAAPKHDRAETPPGAPTTQVRTKGANAGHRETVSAP